MAIPAPDFSLCLFLIPERVVCVNCFVLQQPLSFINVVSFHDVYVLVNLIDLQEETIRLLIFLTN